MDIKFDYDIFEQVVQLLVIGLIIYFFYYYANSYNETFGNYDGSEKKIINRDIPTQWINTPFGYGFGDMNPAETLPILIDTYGTPDMLDPRKGGSAIWYKKSLPKDLPFELIEIKDEQIPSDKPFPHTDFLYTAYKVEIPENMIGSLHKISKSITYDPLKKIMSARNFDIKANVVTHWIVKHFALGKLNIDEAVSMYGPMTMEILADSTGVKYRELLSEL